MQENVDELMDITIRDWFAGQALTGMLAAFAQQQNAVGKFSAAEFARMSYAQARAMMEERARNTAR